MDRLGLMRQVHFHVKLHKRTFDRPIAIDLIRENLRVHICMYGRHSDYCTGTYVYTYVLVFMYCVAM